MVSFNTMVSCLVIVEAAYYNDFRSLSLIFKTFLTESIFTKIESLKYCNWLTVNCNALVSVLPPKSRPSYAFTLAVATSYFFLSYALSYTAMHRHIKDSTAMAVVNFCIP